MLRVWCGAALVLTALFATANMALSREWQVGETGEDWQVVIARIRSMNDYPAYIMNFDGGSFQPLELEGWQVTRPECSPDGNTLTFFAEGTIYVAAADGHTVRPIHPDAFILAGNVTVSNNGSRVIFRGTLDGEGIGTYLVTSESAIEIGATLPTYGTGSYPTFEFDLSPDGSLIAYHDPSYSLNVVNLDNELLAQLPDAFEPAWSPEGILAFSAHWNDSYNIYVMDVERSIIRQLTHLTGVRRNSEPAWTPDGNQIVYAHYDRPDDDHWYDLYVMNADGSDQRPLTDPPTPVTWACVLTTRPDI